MTDVTEALSASVLAIDGSRRVGWARAYAAAEQADNIARDLNIARGDLNAATKFAGFLYGLITVIAPELIEELPSDHAGIMTFLPAASLSAGQSLGRRKAPLRKKRQPHTQQHQAQTPRPPDKPPWRTADNFHPERAWTLIQRLRSDLLALSPDAPLEPIPCDLTPEHAWEIIQNLRADCRELKSDTPRPD